MLSSLTIRGWPRRIEATDPFPHPFRHSFQQLGLDQDEPPCLLYSPRARFGRHESTAKLLVWAGRRLACLDARRGGVVTTVLSLDEVHEVEWGQALLDAWIRLVAHGPGGLSAIQVDFNAVGLELYKPIADAARSVAYARAHLSVGDEGARLAPLAQLDQRFVGFGRQALLSGVELRRHWFQPRVVGPSRRPFDRIPALLLMVTQAELILVREQPVRAPGRYGTVWTCLPLRSIQGVALAADPERAAVSLRLALPGGAEVRADTDTENEDALRAFLQAIDPRWGESVGVLPPPPPASAFGASVEAPPP